MARSGFSCAAEEVPRVSQQKHRSCRLQRKEHTLGNDKIRRRLADPVRSDTKRQSQYRLDATHDGTHDEEPRAGFEQGEDGLEQAQ